MASRRSDKASLKLSEGNTIRLIQLYRREPSLYDSSWEDYRNKDLRAAALRRICATLAVDGFGPKEVATKFRNLRNSYSQELKKIQDSERSAENVYVPKVYWFNIMDSFLRSQMYTRTSRSSMSLEQTTPYTKKNHVLPEVIQAIKIEVEEDNTSILYDSTNEQVYPEDEEEENEAPALKKLRTVKELEDHSSDNSSFSNKPRSTSRRKTPSRQKRPAVGHPRKKKLRDRSQEVVSGPSGRSCEELADMYGNFGQFVAGVLREVGGQRAILMTSEITAVLVRHMATSHLTDSDLSS